MSVSLGVFGRATEIERIGEMPTVAARIGFVRVRVLGPVGVWSDGREVAIPSGKPLAVLALLALAKGDPVSAERLVLNVWGDDAPQSTLKTLQVHVSTLRACLRSAGVEVVHSAAGYRLALDAHEIDIVCFERLAEQGFTALEENRPEVASRVLKQALELWSGEELSNVVDAPFATEEIERLASSRLAVFQASVDADLRLGLGPALLHEVRSVAAANPYDERACGQLMLILYRSGKPAAALDAYQSFRHTLGNELGLEPGHELAELERQILTHDDRLTVGREAQSRRSSNLPQDMSSFIGREEELSALREAVLLNRLITIAGVGGVGKTRIAIAAASSLSDETFEAIWFVELASMTTANSVEWELAELVGSRPDTGLEGVVNAIDSKSVLIVLDNCEHLVAQVAELTGALLRRCSNLRILATSREPIAIDGECVYRLSPLTLVRPEGVDAKASHQSDAVRLFEDRAVRQQSTFRIDDGNARIVARICQRVDGLPLAIELASARLRTLPVDEIDRRLDERFELLTSSNRGKLPRQQTLKALVDWSYDLLTPHEQLLLDQLSVFVGGFTLQDFEAIFSTTPGPGMLDLLTALVDKSLVELSAENACRFRLLETIRTYAAARLHQRGEAIVTGARFAHARHFESLALAEIAARSLGGVDGQPDWLERLSAEHENLLAALSTLSELPDTVDDALGLAAGLGDYWMMREHLREGASVIADLLRDPRVSVDRPEYVVALCVASELSELDGALAEANHWAAQAEELARRHRDPDLHLRAVICAAQLKARAGHGEKALDQLATLNTDIVSGPLGIELVGLRGYILLLLEDLPGARSAFEAMAVAATASGDRLALTVAMVNMSCVDTADGQLDHATDRLSQANELATNLGDKVSLLWVNANLGVISVLENDRVTAARRFGRALQMCSRSTEWSARLCCFLGMALCPVDGPHGLTRSATLHGVIDAMHHEPNSILDPAKRKLRERDRARLRHALGDVEFERALQHGGRLSVTEAIALANTLRQP